ncbi:MAG: hypothetical protein Aurels2KO_04010 [Aureliella sp.]
MRRLIAFFVLFSLLFAVSSAVSAGDDLPAESYKGAGAPTTEESIYGQGVRETRWKSPQEEAAGFHLPPGFHVNLFASEPMIAKPLNVAWDHKGRLWVTSTVEYPYPAEDPAEARDKILILEDTDNDGAADKVTTFAQGLNIPMGLLPMQDGVIAFNIPNIVYFRDTDGDGQSDQQDVLLGPFDTSRDTHGMINSLRYGGDGWIYACHGFNNQSEVTDGSGHTIRMHSGNTFRFTPDGKHVEVYSRGQVNPFGMTCDEWGNWYSADCHSKPITALIRGGCYPSFGRPHDGLGFAPSMMDHLHGSTAISGLCYYQAEHFPPAYRRRFYSGNVMTSRINCNALRRAGATARAEELPDFLTSDDPWFRPVDIQLGPDGGLYVADFYNKIIGHYEVPLTHPGRDRTSGRIWRITYTGGSEPAPNRRSQTDAANMTELLSSPNTTLRRLAVSCLAHRLQSHSEDASRLRKHIEEMATDRSLPAARRVAAVRVLALSHQLPIQLAELLLQDRDAFVVGCTLRILANLPSSEFRTSNLTDIAIDQLQHQEPQVVLAAIGFLGALREDLTAPSQAVPLRLLATAIATDDPTIRQAARTATRDLLRNPELLATVHERLFHTGDSAEEPPKATRLRDGYIGILPALESEFAATRLLDYVASLQGDVVEDRRSIIESALQLAKQFPATTDFRSWVSSVEKLTNGDSNSAANLLSEFVQSHRSSGAAWDTEALESISRYRDLQLSRAMIEMAKAIGETGPSLSWRAIDANAHPIPVQNRTTTNGDAIELWSSFPLGEQHTGRWQSESFSCPDRLSFWLAGHNDRPSEPDHGKSFVRLLDNRGNEIFRATPPRNDVAHHVTWQLKKHAKSQVRFEIVDGDNSAAYAWLAVGGFNLASLNPSDQTQTLGTIRKLVELPIERPIDLQTQAFMNELLANALSPAQRTQLLASLLIHNSQPLAALLVQFASTSDLEHLVPTDWPDEAALTQESVQLFAGQLARSSDALRQRELTTELLQSAAGCRILASLFERGVIGAVALGPKPDILPSGVSSKENQILQDAFSSVSSAEEVRAIVAKRFAALDWSRPSVEKGKHVFETRCASCHQLGGKGAVIGPQLDGAIKRSRQRLAEDILAPNMNVDIAFRTTSLLLDDDSVVAGLITSETNDTVALVQSDGKPQMVAADRIVLRKQSALSLMPRGLAEQISDTELVDLLYFLTASPR